MALTKCKECQSEISDSATSCPKCGAKVLKKTSTGTWVITGFIVLILFSAASQRAPNPSIDSAMPAALPSPTTYAVTYHVDGSARTASLTYNNAQGGTQQEIVEVPWKITFPMQSGSHIYISAQNQGSYGDIAVRIAVDGNDFKRSESSGGYTIATASGSCCK